MRQTKKTRKNMTIMEIQLRNKAKQFIVLLIVLIASSCNNESNSITLKPINRYSSKITYDKIQISYINKDSIKFVWIFNGAKWNRESYFKIKPKGVFEKTEIMTDIVSKFKKEEILTFSKTDTNFIHRGSIYYPSVKGTWIFKRDCRYKIEKVNSSVSKTTITSMVDSSYKEIYYYNTKDFDIIRFEYHTSEHKYIYVR